MQSIKDFDVYEEELAEKLTPDELTHLHPDQMGSQGKRTGGKITSWCERL